MRSSTRVSAKRAIASSRDASRRRRRPFPTPPARREPRGCPPAEPHARGPLPPARKVVLTLWRPGASPPGPARPTWLPTCAAHPRCAVRAARRPRALRAASSGRHESDGAATMKTAKVLVSDKLSDSGLNVLRSAPGIEVDYRPGLSEQELAEAIVDYDALVIRSGSKVTAKVLEKADSLQVIGRAGIGVDNVDVPAASRKGVVVMNTPTGNAVTTAEHALSLLMSLARKIPQADRLDEGRQVGEEQVRGHRDRRQDAGHHRHGQHRPDRRRPRPGPEAQADRVRSGAELGEGREPRRRAGHARRAVRARRLHHDPRAAHARDQEPDQRRRDAGR